MNMTDKAAAEFAFLSRVVVRDQVLCGIFHPVGFDLGIMVMGSGVELARQACDSGWWRPTFGSGRFVADMQILARALREDEDDTA